MSEKGVLSKSIANNISEAIIDKLGGTGYAPTEWSKNINLLGIASADIEEALASITEDASSSDKGLLSLSIASDMGAILNKKYNTSRGFKPSEVSSAVSMLSPLPEKTASGAIAVVEDGADDVPTKSLVVTIPPTFSGVSSVTETQTGRNLLLPQNTDSASVTVNGITRSYLLFSQTFTMTGTNTKTDSAWLIFNGSDWIIDGLKKGETYTFYHNLGASMYSQITYYDTNGALKALVNLAGSAGKNNTRTLTIPSDFDRVRNFQIGVYARATDINEDAVFMLCAGSTAHDYEPYQTPTQYTASLGRTIYGGQVDIVKGEGKETYANTSLTDKNYYYSSSLQRFDCALDGVISSGYMDDFIPPQGYTIDHALIVDGANAPDHSMCIYGGKLYIKNLSCSSVSELVSDMSGKYLTYSLATPTDFTFTGQEVNTRPGYNAFWSDEGDTEVTYRADLDLYEAPSMLLETNNTETEENEEQEENE